MNISRFNVSFSGKIIDSHVHSGNWQKGNGIYNYTPDIDTFTKAPLENGDTVEKVIVSNLDCMVHLNKDNEPIKFMSNEIKGNKDVLDLSKTNPKIIPLATCQAGYGNVENIKTLFGENPDRFAGLKFHPEQLQNPANDSCYEPYMKFAQENKLPCLFHSGQTYDITYPDGYVAKASIYAKPEQIYETARKFPDTPVIMAHMGGNEGVNTMAAVDCIVQSVRNKDAKLYADISWVDCDNPAKPTLKETIKRLKEVNALDRIIYGSDAPLGRYGAEGENGVPPIKAYTKNIEDTKKMIKSEFSDADEIIDKIFYKNAENLFFKKNQSAKSSKILKTAVGAVVLLGAVAGGIAYAVLGKKSK